MSQLQRAKVYRNVELRQEWLGLEPFDLVALGGLAWILMLVNRAGLAWNLLTIAIAYVALRLAKRGKPENYTTTVIRFFLRRPFFSAAARARRAIAFPSHGSAPPERTRSPR